MDQKYSAKVAVAAAPYWVDRPFDYLIPHHLLDIIKPGVRVTVPFSRGNRRSEGIILKTEPYTGEKQLKAIEAALDSEPQLAPEQIKLALWMRERFFCTVYSALKAMLPAGLWFRDDGKPRVTEKTVKFIELCVSAEEARALADRTRKTAAQQAEMLNILCAAGRISDTELLRATGSARPSLNSLIKKRLVSVTEEESLRRPTEAVESLPFPELNAEQAAAYDSIKALLLSDDAKAALIFGVTGSGKTAVYMRLIADCRALNKSAILLVPEIALTPQMIETFAARFGDEVAVLHSSLAAGERYDEYRRIKSGAARVIIGTRSAIFAPAVDLGAIIIDEEQEDSYRSENEPRYHARDIAKYRCADTKSLLLLGSATPCVESMFSAKTQKYSFFSLPARYNEQEMPEVKIVDMKRELRAGLTGSVSSYLRAELQKNIDDGRQSIIFINRRGASKLITCRDCGFTYRCPKCSVNLTYHSYNNRLICHHCGFSKPIDNYCPDCSGSLSFVGDGTQRIVEELSEYFPETGIIRMDTDTVSAAGSHGRLLARFRDENIPIMVGTQMVTKGLNFENVTLVGVLSADQSLYSGDYRSGERTFSLITQVVGRSGRGAHKGRAIIQTFTPENEVIRLAAAQDYEGFYSSEIALRELQGSPPFFELYALNVTGPDEQIVLKACHAAKKLLESAIEADAKILGPAPLFVVRVNDRYRYRVTICVKNGRDCRRALESAVVYCNTEKALRGVLAFAEKDPTD